MPKYKLKRLYILLLLPITFIFTMLAKQHPERVETYYSRGFYSVFSSAINTITSFVDFSVAEVVIIAFIVFVIGFILYYIFKIWRSEKSERLYQLFLCGVNSLVIFSVIFFGFNLTCGLNYHRKPFAQQIELDISNTSVDQLYSLAQSLAEDANTLKTQVKSDSNGIMVISGREESIMDEARKAMNNVAKDYPVLGGMYFQPKPVKFSKGMSRMGISGVFFPFTYEANVNMNAPQYERPHTMAHELVHLRGFMKEEEANFIGYLACMSIENPDFQYSGTMVALQHTLSSLSRADNEKYQEIRASLSEGVIADMDYSNNYWNNDYNGVISSVSTSINDTYLKANNQKEGVASYGAMVNLLIAYKTQQI